MDRQAGHLLPGLDDAVVQGLPRAGAVLQRAGRVRLEIFLVLLQDELSIGGRRRAQGGDGVLVQVVQQPRGAEGAAIIVDEETGTAVPGPEEGPSSLRPP